MYPNNIGNVTNENNSIINGGSNNNFGNKTNTVLKIVVWILIVLLIIAAGYYVYDTLKEEKENFTFDFDISAVGFEFDEAFDIKKYEYNLEVDAKEVQINCSTMFNVEGCNEIVTIDKDIVDHVVKYSYDADRVYTYIIHISRKETLETIKVNSVKNTNGNIIVDAYSTLNNELEYSFDGGLTWQKSNKYKVDDNIIVNLIIRDNNGNTTKSITLEVNDIDKVPPTVDIIVSEKTETKIILYAKAHDDYSGIDSYNWNNSGYGNSITYEVKKPGTYSLKVKDKSGNESIEKSITIKDSDFVKKTDNNPQVKKTYTINLVSNGSDINNSSLSCSTTGLNCKIKLPNISKTGGIVIGWSENSNAKTAQYKSGEEISVTENKILYAITAKKLIVTFDKNEATSISKKTESCTMYNTGSSCSIILPTITMNGGTVLGWAESKSAKTAKYSVSSTILINSNKTLYAVTRKESSITPPTPTETTKQLTVTFDKNGATSIGKSSLSCTSTNGNACSITLPSITKSGWTILGWSEKKDSRTVQYKVNEKISVTSNKTLYAITSKTVTAIFDKNEATSISKKTESCTMYNTGNSCRIILPTITMNRGTVLGWAESKSATTAKYSVSSTISISSNKTLYAITKKSTTSSGTTTKPTNPTKPQETTEQLTVTFDKNGATSIGDSSLGCTSANGNSCSITLPSITKSGWTILGWSEDKNAKVAQYKVAEKINIMGNKTLYAITSKTITATFEVAGARDVEYSSKSCTIYNNQSSCSIKIPFNNRPGLLSFGYNVKGNSKTWPDYIINKSYSFTNSVTLTPNYNEKNKYYRNISLASDVKYGSVRVEIDSNCPRASLAADYIKNVYSSRLSFLFKNPSKLTVLSSDVFIPMHGSGLAGSTVGEGDYDWFPTTDINCWLYRQAVVHELTHKWDKEYMLKYGDFIAHQSDVMNLYNKYRVKSKSERPLRDYSYTNEYEFFADMVQYYYEYYITKDHTGIYNVGFYEDIRQVVEKYIAKGI